MRDYYYILGLTINASKDQIKKAYRKLSLKFHPDQNNGDKFFEERFREINEAYETLSNDFKRKVYDEALINKTSDESKKTNYTNYQNSQNVQYKNKQESKSTPTPPPTAGPKANQKKNKALRNIGLTVVGLIIFYILITMIKDSNDTSILSKNQDSTQTSTNPISTVDKKEIELKERELALKEKDTNNLKPVPEVSYKSYTPCTFRISLPSNFNLQSIYDDNSPNYCDYSVKTKDGFEILQLHSLLSSRFAFGTIKELYDAAIKGSYLEITYKLQKGNWFVISGTQKKNGNIVYWKRVLGFNFVSDLWIEYPKSRETEITPYIKTISNSFTSQ